MMITRVRRPCCRFFRLFADFQRIFSVFENASRPVRGSVVASDAFRACGVSSTKRGLYLNFADPGSEKKKKPILLTKLVKI